MTDILLWYIMVSLIGWLAFPLAYRLLPGLSDRGYSLSRPLGLLIWGFLFWLLASLKVVTNSLGGVVLVLILFAGASLWSVRGEKRKEILDFLREKKTLILVGEVLFLVGFAFLCLMRAVGPDISGTEKPMELAFINSILRSPSFPPNDPWLSGYSISYYYFGYVMVAMLARLTGVPAAISFNLAIAAWFAMIALAATGIVYNLLMLRSSQSKKSAPFWSLLAPLFILLMGNLEGFLEMLHARGLFWTQGADGSWTSGFWSWLNILEINQPPTPPFSWVPERATGIWWWRASRVLQDFDALGNSREIIDEFPFFSFFLADLHPHVLSIPFVLLAVGIALNLYLQSDENLFDGSGLLAGLVQWFKGETTGSADICLAKWIKRPDFWLAALLFGGLSFLNTWDFPIYVALFSLVYAFKRFLANGWSAQRILDFVEMGFVQGVLGVMLFLPFYLGFASQAGGVLPSLNFFTRGVYFWVMFAPMLVPIFIWLLREWKLRGNHFLLSAGLKIAGGVVFGLWLISYLLGWLGLSLPVLGNLISTSDSLSVRGRSLVELGGLLSSIQGSSEPAGTLILNSLARRFMQPGTWLTLLVLLTLLAGLLLSFGRKKITESETLQDEPESNSDRANTSPAAFVLLLILVGAGLTLVPEFIYLRDQFGWRMNTIFKFYYEAWILWGVAGAFATACLWQSLKSGRALAFRILSLLLIFISLAYPYFGIQSKFNSIDPETLSLDGAGYLAKYSADDYAGIEWLQTAPLGTVAEAVGGSYSGYARAATFSGMPNVLGWPGHESQWRGGAVEMGSRQSDIQRLYETSDWSEAQEILVQYDIRYVFVGSFERNAYRVNEVKFQNRLKPVFSQGNVIIYEVPNLNYSTE